MIWLLSAVLFAAGTGASAAQNLWGHVWIYGICCALFLAAGVFDFKKDEE